MGAPRCRALALTYPERPLLPRESCLRIVAEGCHAHAVRYGIKSQQGRRDLSVHSITCNSSAVRLAPGAGSAPPLESSRSTLSSAAADDAQSGGPLSPPLPTRTAESRRACNRASLGCRTILVGGDSSWVNPAPGRRAARAIDAAVGCPRNRSCGARPSMTSMRNL